MSQSKAKARRKTAGQTYKFADLRAEAARLNEGVAPQPEVPPFVIDDVSPPIVITAPDTLERQLVIADAIGEDGAFHRSQTLPLLRALCGDAFGRVWTLIRNDKDPQTAIALVQTLVGHFLDAIEGEAMDLPGGSEGSSD